MSEDINRIFPGFYIGSLAAVKRDVLEEYQITHVLSIMNGFKPKWPKLYKFQVIDIYDMDGVDIKQYFEQTFEFIEEGRREGAVLVHCFAGMSRSASVCIAYMMRKLNIDYSDAHGLLSDARPIIYPNSGFVRQLKEFEKELVEKKRKEEKKALKAAEKQAKAESAEQSAEPLVNETVESFSQLKVESLTATDDSVDDDDDSEDEDKVIKYCCRKCGKTLFTKKDLAIHDRGDGQTSFKWARRERNATGKEECMSMFLQEIDWVTWITTSPETIDGKIICDNPKCGEKLGSWSWSGAQCSCGTWVTPAFQIPKSRVDEKNASIDINATILHKPPQLQQQQQNPTSKTTISIS